MNNKISEKAVWDNGITADEPDYMSTKQSIQTSVQSHPQMMFCYNCNQVIPSDSAFCPWCKTELFTKCPKCGKTYSSQYTFCYSCGVNKDEYLIEQEQLHLKEDKIRKELERTRQLEVEKIEKEKQDHEQMITRIRASAEYNEAKDYCIKLNQGIGIRQEIRGTGIFSFVFGLIFFVLNGFMSGSESSYMVMGGFIILGILLLILFSPHRYKNRLVLKGKGLSKRSHEIVKDVTNPESKNYYYYGIDRDVYVDSYLDLFGSSLD